MKTTYITTTTNNREKNTYLLLIFRIYIHNHKQYITLSVVGAPVKW